jgi:hypothetical protein
MGVFTKEEVISLIQILEDGSIQVRKSIRILEDGVKVGEKVYRHVVPPDDMYDISGEDADVQAIAAIVQTPEKKQKYKDKTKEDKDLI